MQLVFPNPSTVKESIPTKIRTFTVNMDYDAKVQRKNLW